MSKKPSLVHLKEAAIQLKHLGVSVNWLKKEVLAKKLPALVVDMGTKKNILVDVDTLEAALTGRAHGLVMTNPAIAEPHLPASLS